MQKFDLKKNREALLRQRTIAPTEDNYSASLEHKAADEEKLNILSFYLGGQEYAFEVADAVEVLRPRQVTEVPRTPAFIVGILSVRGEMVPIIDLKMRLGGPAVESKPSNRIIIVSVDDLKAGFLVDRLSGVKEVRAKALDSLMTAPGLPENFLKGVIEVNEKKIFLLDSAGLTHLSEQQ